MSAINDSNGSGKRERSEDEPEEEPQTKALKSEDEAKAPTESAPVDRESEVATKETTTNEEAEPEHESTSRTVEKKGTESPKDGNKTNTTSKQKEVPPPKSSSNPKPQVSDPRRSMSAPQATTNNPPPVSAPSINVNQSNNNPNQIIEEKGEVSPLYVGRVIGKGGEMIRDLQARSGARIDVDQNVPPGHPRVITYKGTRQTVDFAKQLVAILSREGASENDLPLGHASLEQLVIPAQSVGKVIGRGGEMIRELQSRSQAKIQIDHTGRSGHPPDQKLVTITGTNESAAKAKEMVGFLVANPMMDAQQSLNMLAEEKTRSGLPWGSGPPYPNLPNQGVNMNPQMIQQSHPPMGHGTYPPNSTGGYNQPTSSYGGAHPTVGSYPSQMSYPPQNLGPGSGPGGREVEVFYAAKQYMGRIIGGKGITVNDLQRRSGCEIQINQDVPPGQDCEITLKGSRQGIESAKHMIRDIIETGPQHPYAGGADTYGGGTAYPQQRQQTIQQQGGFQQPVNHQQVYDPNYGQPSFNQQPTYPAAAAFGHSSMPAPNFGNYAAPQQPFNTYTQQPVVPVPQFHAQPQYPPPQPKSMPVITSPWKTATAPDGQVYYYNERTGETQWDKPAGMP